MAFNVRKLTQCDYLTSVWSGGTTTQLAIFPPDAVYAHRDFLWRVSSATVDLEESDFTPLPDYERLIATLEGDITLTHKGGAPITLQPFQVHGFSGGDATHSVGRCRDFNLMLRRGRATGSVEPIFLTGTPISLPVEAAETVLLYCAEGFCTGTACSAGNLPAVPPAASDGAPVCAAAEVSPACHSERSEAESKNPSTPVSLRAGETLLLTALADLTLTGQAKLMLCRIRAHEKPTKT